MPGPRTGKPRLNTVGPKHVVFDGFSQENTMRAVDEASCQMADFIADKHSAIPVRRKVVSHALAFCLNQYGVYVATISLLYKE